MSQYTEQEYRDLLARDKSKSTPRRKYRNEPVTVEGEHFDSKREAARWVELQVQERAGLISKLRRQVPFALVVNRQHIANYVCDFCYERDGVETVEDVKSPASRTPLYMLKKKLMRAVYSIEILET